MSTIGAKTRYTPEDLLAMPDRKNFELVDGELVERDMGWYATWIGGQLYLLLTNYCKAKGLGWTAPGDASYQCFSDDPNKVRKPDVSFVRLERISPGQEPPPHCPTPSPASRRGEPAWEVAFRVRYEGGWTEAEYLALDTKRLVELSNGCLEVLPMPTIFHQLIVDYLHNLLKAFVAVHPAGIVLFAPLPVHLWSGQLREPDIVYFRPHRVKDPHGQPEGADLVVTL